MQKFINTFVDGTDLKEVNLWNHMTKRTNIVTVCQDDDLVTVLKIHGVYARVRAQDGKIGWCMTGFQK